MTLDRDKAWAIICDYSFDANYWSAETCDQVLDQLEECYKPLDYQLEANKIATETFRTFLKLKEGPTK